MSSGVFMKLVGFHTPVNFLGVNFGTKIDIYAERRGQVTAEWFEQLGILHVTYKGQRCRIPSPTISYMVDDDGSPADRGGPSGRLPNPLDVDNTSKLRDPMGTGRKLADPPPPAVADSSAEADKHFATQTTKPLSDYEAERGDPSGQVFAGPGAVPVRAPRYTKVNK